ncbi:uncharacterized protein BX664DRAFT_385934 [Halteromyces radiatus]|uniref:uncharacterized protein n=1 Tax=Halteromyces radiatus TaxID=101107 RepID=UPI00222096C5|nr:uncharacterized protein BX664DRAFT_385934 [Halteromyces radiatus]KAI8089449.1 hypothetical protein BX664DRAFT_385934 [Halteromyces radiatus]
MIIRRKVGDEEERSDSRDDDWKRTRGTDFEQHKSDRAVPRTPTIPESTMSTMLFISESKKFDKFIPSFTNNTSTKTQTTKIQKKKKLSIVTNQRRRSSNHSQCLHTPSSPTNCNNNNDGIRNRKTTNEQGKNRRYITDDQELMTLEDELDYTQDTLATLNVMFGSLRQAYVTCAPQLDPHATRLDAMEKELLSAYDDLELQVIHLDRHIKKLELSWHQWKSAHCSQPTTSSTTALSSSDTDYALPSPLSSCS